MTAVINTGLAPKALQEGVKAFFHQASREHPAKYSSCFDTYNSGKAFEEYIQYASFGEAAVKPQGSPITYDIEEQGYISRLVNSTIALGFGVTMEEIQDNQYAELAERRAGRLARVMNITKDVIGANVYNRATNASYTGGDGVTLLNTAHVTVGAGNQSNKLAVAADWSEQSLEDLTIQIGKAVDERGLKFPLNVQRAIIPIDLQYEAQRVLESMLQSGTANNDVNALRAMGAIPEVFMNIYLTDTDAYFLKTDADVGMIYQERMAREFDQDNDFNTKNLLYSAVERYAFGWGDWRGVYGSEGA